MWLFEFSVFSFFGGGSWLFEPCTFCRSSYSNFNVSSLFWLLLCFSWTSKLQLRLFSSWLCFDLVKKILDFELMSIDNSGVISGSMYTCRFVRMYIFECILALVHFRLQCIREHTHHGSLHGRGTNENEAPVKHGVCAGVKANAQ